MPTPGKGNVAVNLQKTQPESYQFRDRSHTAEPMQTAGAPSTVDEPLIKNDFAEMCYANKISTEASALGFSRTVRKLTDALRELDGREGLRARCRKRQSYLSFVILRARQSLPGKSTEIRSLALGLSRLIRIILYIQNQTSLHLHIPCVNIFI